MSVIATDLKPAVTKQGLHTCMYAEQYVEETNVHIHFDNVGYGKMRLGHLQEQIMGVLLPASWLQCIAMHWAVHMNTHQTCQGQLCTLHELACHLDPWKSTNQFVNRQETTTPHTARCTTKEHIESFPIKAHDLYPLSRVRIFCEYFFHLIAYQSVNTRYICIAARSTTLSQV